MSDLTHDDITRWFDGATEGLAAMLPEGEWGAMARQYARSLSFAAHNALDEAGVPREAPPEA